uniref:Uncharacterized protein n=1 Tax=Nicotiana tabacum TaxID=4097 RepID=A0A1S4CEG9_TOBAC|nr:PREDICTED: uncharacterized protein LOC107818152 [Nicotiana tabacum]
MRDAFEMFQGAQSEPNDEAKRFYEQLEEASCPLYEGSMHSKLSVAVRLLTIKSDSSISQAGMDSIIGLMNELNPNKVDLPKDFYAAKKIGVQDDAALENCKFCNQPRYKEVTNANKKKVPMKAMHYLPLIPRLKRLYATMSSAPHMRWHYEHRRPTAVLRHPSDGEAWKHFDRVFPDCASEPRNIRLGLRVDGFTPFAVSAAPYSCWSVFVTPYNLPPEFFLSPKEIWNRVRDLPKLIESPLPNKIHGYGVTHNWTKQSIFWELPYWKHYLLRYNLYVMHIEKNFFDNLFNTVMDVNNKTKDNLKAKMDLKEYCRRSELYLTYLNNKIQKPKTTNSLWMREERFVIGLRI